MATKLSPVFALLVESSVWVRILIGVPAAMVTGSDLGDAGASAFAGGASEAGVKPVTVDESEVLLHPANASARTMVIPTILSLFMSKRCRITPKCYGIITLRSVFRTV